MNFETDTEQMLAFFRGRSEFYPEFDRHLRLRVFAKFPPVEDANDDE